MAQKKARKKVQKRVRKKVQKKPSYLARVEAICLALPDTKRTDTWGEPHFRVGEKIFAGYGEGRGVEPPSIGFKLEKPHAAELCKRDGFVPAAYVGKHGWVQMALYDDVDWDVVREYVLESYCLIAPKKSLAKLDEA